ncbi:hypothetical protein OHA21_06330 [Actinoplanes sp. NBC_00393]|uniref:SCO4225 family membrane protein n=1 Tax=Actinoplanes sp. NBC_00393 TaxID=2975953 RepID=UPI002E1FDE52
MKIVRWFVGSWVSRVYLAVVAAVLAYELWLLLTTDGTTYTITGVLSMLLAAPTSWLLDLIVPWPASVSDVWRLAVFVPVGALANAAAWNGIRLIAAISSKSANRAT